jgi:hypothetical protein
MTDHRQIVLERDMQAKCWCAWFWGFDNLPHCKLPLPWTTDADVYAVAYALRDKHGPVDIVNKVGDNRYSITFVK